LTVLAHEDPLTPNTTAIAAVTTAKPLKLNNRIRTPWP
jgi:hypothetical protein